MTDTNQLPEPDLGYIKTDISNQPAFSARQMREAMTHTNKLPPLPTPKFTETIRGVPCITVTEHEHLMRAYALQARAPVQGDPSWWTRETDEGAEWTDTAPLVLSGWTPLYTTPQPAQATQAEVTDDIRPEDFTVDVVVKPMGGFAPVNTQGVRVTHKPTGISVTCDAARSQHANRQQAFEKLSAILALRPSTAPNLACRSVQARLAAQWGYVRPAAVPMTDDVVESAKRAPREIARSLKESGMACNCDLDRWEPEKATGHSRVCRIHKAAMSAFLGITAQAKKGDE